MCLLRRSLRGLMDHRERLRVECEAEDAFQSGLQLEKRSEYEMSE